MGTLHSRRKGGNGFIYPSQNVVTGHFGVEAISMGHVGFLEINVTQDHYFVHRSAKISPIVCFSALLLFLGSLEGTNGYGGRPSSFGA